MWTCTRLSEEEIPWILSGKWKDLLLGEASGSSTLPPSYNEDSFLLALKRNC